MIGFVSDLKLAAMGLLQARCAVDVLKVGRMVAGVRAARSCDAACVRIFRPIKYVRAEWDQGTLNVLLG